MKRIIPLLTALTILFYSQNLSGQTIGTFNSIEPKSQDENFHIADEHAWQYLIKAGDGLTAGGNMPVNSDFTGYVPIGGSSTHGYLSINSEFVPGGVTILEIQFNFSTGLWEVLNSEAVDFSDLGNFLVAGTVANCSGTVTPWGTVVTCEENEIAGDLNGDGYIDWGWNIEIDPVTKEIMDYDGDGEPDKIWAMGRFKHENIVVTADSSIAYQGEDNSANGFVYKYVMDTKGDLSSGTLYVLQVTGGTSGNWIAVPNTSQSDRNNTVSLSASAGGTQFNRVEDVEIGPDGKIYFATTGQGKVYRFNDDGNTVSNFEIFIDNESFDISHAGGTTTTTFSGPDNLAFDGDGNLWVLQDGGGKHIWVAGPTHTSSNPDIRVFSNTPLDSEPTGITFSPDYKFMFLSIQHPDNGNSDTQTDIAGVNLMMNRDLTVVIARKEFLGPLAGVDPAQPQNEVMSILAVYPNPVGDIMNIDVMLKSAGKGTVSIKDLTGKTIRVYDQTFKAGENKLNIKTSNLSKGNYFVFVEVNGKIASRKFEK